MTTNIFKFLFDLAETLKGTMQGVYDWMVQDIELLGNTITVYEALFGGGLVIILGYALVRFILSIIP